MMTARLILCAFCCMLLLSCSGDKAKELLETAELEDRQNNVVHAKQLYEDLVRLYPSSPQAEFARARLETLNKPQ
jgi:TolA-binding protein